MARSSQTRGGAAAKALKPKPPLKRAAGSDKAGRKRTAARGQAGPGRAPAREEDRPRRAEALAEARDSAAGTPRPELPRPAATKPVAPRAAGPVAAASAPAVAGGADSGVGVPRRVGTGLAPAIAEIAASDAAPTPEAVEALPEPAAAAEPAPAPAGAIPPPLAQAASQAAGLTAMIQAGCTLVEGSIRVRSQMIGFGRRQAEHGFAFGRAMLAGGSLPEVLALQAEYLGRAIDEALAQSLELSRLSTAVVRAGLESLRPR